MSAPESMATKPDAAVGNKGEAAYQLLRQAILNAELAPGTPLRPSALREVYGIGWTPLREALSRLEAERLVTMQRNHGFAVAPVSLLELADLTRARRVLEQALLGESVRNGDGAWEERLVVAHYRLKSSVLPPGDWSAATSRRWMDCHQAFHLALLSGCAAPWLTHLYMQVMEQERRHHGVLMLEALRQHEALRQTPDASADADADAEDAREATSAPPTPAMAALSAAMDLQHHTALMEAALTRDVDAVSALMAEHVNYKVDVASLGPLLAAPVPEAKAVRSAKVLAAMPAIAPPASPASKRGRLSKLPKTTTA